MNLQDLSLSFIVHDVQYHCTLSNDWHCSSNTAEFGWFYRLQFSYEVFSVPTNWCRGAGVYSNGFASQIECWLIYVGEGREWILSKLCLNISYPSLPSASCQFWLSSLSLSDDEVDTSDPDSTSDCAWCASIFTFGLFDFWSCLSYCLGSVDMFCSYGFRICSCIRPISYGSCTMPILCLPW